MPTETEVLNHLADEAAKPPESKPVESEETKATQVAEPGQEQKEALAEQPLAEVEEELEPNLEETPESSGDFAKYKHLYKDNPDLRNIIGRERAFSDLGDYSEVKGVIEKVPTVADAEDMASKAENHRVMGEAFRESPEEFFGSLAESDPRAFESSVSKLPEILAEEHPNLYSAQAREYSNRVISNVLAIAQNSRDEELLKAAQVVAQFLGVQRFAANEAPRNTEAEKLRRQLRERDEKDANDAFENFYSQTDEAIIDTGVSEIESTIKKALPDATQGQLKRLVNEAWDKVRSTMGAQPQTASELTNRLERARTNGRMGINEHKEIVNFAARRMKLIIPRICKDIISEWSKDVLQRNQKEITTKKDIAQKTRDAGSGPQGTTSAAAAPASGNKRRTSEDVYKELENRTYVPPAARS